MQKFYDNWNFSAIVLRLWANYNKCGSSVLDYWKMAEQTRTKETAVAAHLVEKFRNNMKIGYLQCQRYLGDFYKFHVH